MESMLIAAGVGLALGVGLSFVLGSDGGEKAVLVALSIGAGYTLAKVL